MKIENIKVKNFKILKDFQWDLNDGLNLIYGDNAAGKSTLIEIFSFLEEVFTKELNLSFGAPLKNALPFNDIFKDKGIFQRYKTLNLKNHEKITLEINYSVEKVKYNYFVEMGNDDIISNEHLFQYKGKKTNIIFEKNKNSYRGEIIDELKNEGNALAVNVGSYSFISRIVYLQKTNAQFGKIKNIKEVGKLISGFNILSKYDRELEQFTRFFELNGGVTPNLLLPFQTVDKFNKAANDNIYNIMSKQAKRLSSIVTQFDENIIDLKVMRREVDLNSPFNEYSLFFGKKIDGKLDWIEYGYESNGTKEFLKYFNLLEIINNKKDLVVPIFDEFGVYLHDALTINIFESIIKSCNKTKQQIIITTHCTDLLNLNNDNFGNRNKYIIKNNHGNISLNNLIGIDVKENNKTKFLNGAYGGNNSLVNKLELEIYEEE